MGSKAELTVLRKDRSTIAMLDIEPPPEEPARDESDLDGRQPLAGATVVNLSPAVADEFGLSVLASGVIVTAVAPGSAARRFGFRPLDKLEAVNGRPVTSVAQLRALLSTPAPQWMLSVIRDGKQFNVTLPG